MKKIAIISLIVLAASGAIFYYKRQSDAIKKYKIDIVGWRSRGFNLGISDLELTFKVSSYSDIEATVGDVVLDVYMNGVFMASVNQPESQVIPANGYNYLKVNVKVRNDHLVQQAINLLQQDKNANIEIRIVGTVKVKTGWIGIDIPVDDTQVTSLAKLLS